MDLVKRYLFWMIMAVVMVVVIVADVALVGRAQTDIARTRAKLVGTISDAHTMLSSVVTIPSQEAIEQYHNYKEELQAQVEECLKFYHTMLVVNRPIPGMEDVIDPDTRLPRPEWFATDYPIAMEALRLKSLRGMGTRMGPGTWPARRRTGIPTNADILAAQIEYWLLADILDMLGNRELHVKRVTELEISSGVESFVETLLAEAFLGEEETEEEPFAFADEPFAFADEPRVTGPSFATIPFSIGVEIDYRYVPVFLQTLENMNPQRAVRLLTVNITRLTEPEEQKLFAPMVELHATCEVLHYIERSTPGTSTIGS